MFDWLFREFRLLVGVSFMAMAVFVDFASAFMSRMSDGLFIGAAVFLLAPIIKRGLKD